MILPLENFVATFFQSVHLYICTSENPKIRTTCLGCLSRLKADGKPQIKKSWNFNWRSTIKKKNTSTYVLRLKSNPSSIQGVLHLKIQEGMLIMDLVEIAPHNLGQKNKRYKYVAGCLIAFACRESFKLETTYKGFLTFESKTQLIDWYKEHYYAKVAMGQILVRYYQGLGK